MQDEIWKDIIGYDGLYLISNFGNVVSLMCRSVHRKRTITRRSYPNGYEYVGLHKNSFGKNYLVHRLVGKHFIPNPYNKPEINHKDGDKKNNHVSNLEWVTHSENGLHSFRELGRISPAKGKFGGKNPNSKKINQYTTDGEFIRSWDSISDATRSFGKKNPSVISGCLIVSRRRRRLTAYGYKWEYAHENPELLTPD